MHRRTMAIQNSEVAVGDVSRGEEANIVTYVYIEVSGKELIVKAVQINDKMLVVFSHGITTLS